MIRIKKIILYFCMVTLLVSNISISAFASDLNDGVNDGFDRYMGGTNIQGFNSWDITDKKSLFATNIVSFFSSIGMYFRNGSGGNLMDIFTTHLIESGRIENADNLDEYIASHLTANTDETELYMSSDLTNALHETAVQYIEEETGWYNLPVTSYRNIDASLFYTQTQYNSFLDYCSKNVNENCFVAINSYGTAGYRVDNVAYDNSFRFYLVPYENLLYIPLNVNGVRFSGVSPVVNWALLEKEKIKDIYLDSNGGVIKESQNSSSTLLYFHTTQNQYNSCPRAFFYSDITIRAYKTLDDLKQYAVGQRPYYITDAFKNYDSTVDNSTTITQTEIDNSVTYGDVYNYITNNYDNPDGLSEDELRAILEEYLKQINNSGGSGSGNSGGSGGGLSGFLDGLGSLGDALLAIIGKLLEYVGKAIELLSGTVTKVIDLVPQNITNLISGLFPFIPQEWLVAIELSLVLAVVIGIVGMFKK